MTTIEERLQRMEDIHSVQNLCSEIQMWMDDIKGRPDIVTEQSLANIFTEDCKLHFGDHGVIEGCGRATKEFWQDIAQNIAFSQHHMTTCKVDVKGSDAAAVFYCLVTASPQHFMIPTSVWAGETWRIGCRKNDRGKWHIHTIFHRTHYITSYAGPGWDKENMASEP
jgi:G:T-mismatch repair DNA endonuclease (very short patch repair protein)